MLSIFKYNGLIYLKNLVHEACNGIDVQLKRRYDLIPNLIATVQGYSQHEKQTFENVTILRRNLNNLSKKGKIIDQIGI